MKTKQLIERALPFSGKYIYLGITRGSIESGQCTTCDNCGTLITNMVEIADNATGKRYTIGTDCTETLVKAKCLYNGIGQDYEIDIYSYNLAARFITEVRKGCRIENNGVFCTLIDSKGKTKTVLTNNIKKYFPEYL